jgi:hypothetical protein
MVFMKIINSINGTVVLHVSGDVAVPVEGVLPQQIISLMGHTYHFASLPQFVPGIPLVGQPLVFQSGLLTKGNKNYPHCSDY